jgi:hypothetical protein
MATLIDLNAELAKLTMLRERTPQTTRAERQGSSAQLAPYRDGAVFTTKFAGEGAWEPTGTATKSSTFLTAVRRSI